MNRGVFEANKGLVRILGALAFPLHSPAYQSNPVLPHPRPNLSKKTPDAQGQLTSGDRLSSTGHSRRERVPLPIAEICKERKRAAGVTRYCPPG